MVMPENWPLPLSILKDEEASFGPRQELGYKKISEIELENRPSFADIARHIVENSSIPERFYDDVMKWLEDGFRNLPDWREWLLRSKPSSTLPPVLEVEESAENFETEDVDEIEDDDDDDEL